ncbi:MAG: 50S ribosomal protein L13 [Bacilli bacterium]
MKNTYMQKKEEVVRNWYIIDAEGLTLGRLATKVAHVLRGKHKVTYTPHIDGGDNVIIINADKVVLTGNKLDKKIYYNHSGFTGGLRERTARVMKDKYPVEMVERAIKGMLPNGRLGRQMYKKLFVYAGEKHPHAAQQPVELKMEKKEV